MGRLEQVMESKEFKRFLELDQQLESGRLKKWLLANGEDDLDDEVASYNFNVVMNSGLTQKHIKGMKKLHGA
jgi:hypothetical protein